MSLGLQFLFEHWRQLLLDHELFLVTDDVDHAVGSIQRFWHSYHSIRWAGDRLVIRLRYAPTDAEIADLNEGFADLLVDGRIERTDPLPAEVSDRDNLDLARIVMQFDARRAARLRGLIDALNDLPSAETSARREADGAPPAP